MSIEAIQPKNPLPRLSCESISVAICISCYLLFTDQSDTMQCKKCLLEIDGGICLFTVCGWRCRQPFHGACANLPETAADTLRCRNVLWVCDDCMTEFRSTRDKLYEECPHVAEEPATTAQEISELKAKVAEISETLSLIAPHRIPSTAYDELHSTPVSHFALLDGTRIPEQGSRLTETTADGISISTAQVESRTEFVLFLSNIDFRTTEDDIRMLVCQSLGISEPHQFQVRKLVSKWRTFVERDSISFKIVLDIVYKAAAMNPGTWPRGVRFREFVQRCSTWKPKR